MVKLSGQFPTQICHLFWYYNNWGLLEKHKGNERGGIPIDGKHKYLSN